MNKSYDEIPVPKIVLTVRSPTGMGQHQFAGKEGMIDDETFLDETKMMSKGVSLTAVRPRYQSSDLMGQLRQRMVIEI